MFFKKFLEKNKPEEPTSIENENEEYIASLTYSISSDGEVYMDVVMSDYEDKTLQNFAKVIAGVATIRFQLQTIEMIQTSLCSIGEEEVFTKLVEYVLKETQSQADTLEQIGRQLDEKSASEDQDREEQPWIKPSQITN